MLWVAPGAWGDNKTILILGDSISTAYGMAHEDGWVNLLQHRLEQQGHNYQVINASITGDVTASAAKRLDNHLQRHLPDVIIIELGGNDGLRGLPIEQIKSNLQTMINASTAMGTDVVLAGMQILPNYGPRYTDAFAKVYTDLEQQNDIVLIPFILDGIGGVPSMMQSDGIHPNETAQSIILDNVWPALEKQLLRVQ